MTHISPVELAHVYRSLAVVVKQCDYSLHLLGVFRNCRSVTHPSPFSPGHVTRETLALEIKRPLAVLVPENSCYAALE